MLKYALLLSIWLTSHATFAQQQPEPMSRWLPLGLPPHIEKEAREAQTSYEKIHGYLKKNFHKLIDSTSNIYLESEEFGIDHLIVAKVVFGLQRKVEKNPWPTSEADRFLLKDELTIGFRFGAGLVVFGDIGYIKKYTLVQPVASHREGMLANDFIINLMLPFQIESQRLPEKYVLMTEGYLEGRGRLKLGGGIMLNPFVHQSSNSKVELSRTFIDNKNPESMKVFVDESVYKEWGQLLYVTNGFLSYSLLKADYKFGQNKRSFFEIRKNLPEFKEVLYRLTVNNDVEILKDYAIDNFAIDHFKQKSANISLFGLYSSRSRNRFDAIEEYLTDANGEVALVNEQYQSENERERSWFSFISGEEFFSNILFMAYKEDNLIGRPHAILTTRITDKNTSIKELEKKYLKSINQISLNQATIEVDDEMRTIFKNDKPRTSLDMRIIFDEFAMNKLLSLTDKDFWQHVYKVTNTDQERWEMALESSTTSINNRDELRPLARKLRSIAYDLKRIQRCDDSECKMKKMSSLLRTSLYVSGGTFASEVLAIIHSMFKGHVQIEATLGVINDDQYINSYTWDNNIKIAVPQKYYRFNFQRAVEIFHLFDERY